MGKIKQHFQKHKTVYISAGSFVAGVGVTVLLGRYEVITFKPKDVAVSAAQSVKIIGNRNNVNQVMLNLVERSTPSKPVLDTITKAVYSSKSEAARALSISRGQVDTLIGKGLIELLEVVPDAA